MKIATENLLTQLKTEVDRQIQKTQELNRLSYETLNWRERTESWSVLECIEHLKRYNDFYIPEIRSKLGSATVKPNVQFRSGWLGNYFANAMLPKEKLNKMNTFKEMNPLNSHLDIVLLENFEQQLVSLNDLVHSAQQYDLSKVKTSISISKWIKLRLGDTFRVVVNHQTRHFAQIENVIKSMPQ
ncbi:MAG: DinB family protein [Sphingobacteriales bacterium]|nr:MAG: DinB family protein [Sphingobacteriales bacterium]